MLYESLDAIILGYAALLALALLSLLHKKHSRDEGIRRWSIGHASMEPLVDAWLTGQSEALLDVEADELRSRREIIEQLLLQAAAGSDSMWGRALEAFDRLGFTQHHLHELHSWRSARRAKAAYTLGRFEAVSAQPELVRLLSDRHHDVRLAAFRSLARIGRAESLPSLLEAMVGDLSIAPERAAELFLTVNDEVEHMAASWLMTGDEPHRVFGALLLSRAQGLAAHRTLERAALTDESVTVRSKALAGLSIVAARKSTAVLRTCLADPSGDVRAEAARAVGALGVTSLAPTLARSMCDTDYWVRQYASRSLTQLGQPGVRVLETVLTSSDRFARETAAEALQLCGACDQYIDAYLHDVQSVDPELTRERALRMLMLVSDMGATARLTERLRLDDSLGAAALLRQLASVPPSSVKSDEEEQEIVA